MSLPPLNPKIVLCVAAHADDIDWWAGGTVAAWTATGQCQAYLLVLTDGSKGTSDPDINPAKLTSLREEEQRKASKILGFTDVFFGGFVDGELTDSTSVRQVIVEHIRRLKPEVLVTWDPGYRHDPHFGINHPDHIATGQAALAAAYPLARDHLAFPGLGLEPHITRTILMLNPKPHPDDQIWAMDTSKHYETKMEALRAHTTQPGLVSNDPFPPPDTEPFVRIDLKF